MMLMATLAACSEPKSTSEPDSSGRTAGATAACQKAVKEKVADPTAVLSDEKIQGMSFGFSVTGIVSFKDASGAEVKNSFICSANESGVNWVVAQLTLAAA
jgi:hypothetical protein